MIAPDKFNNAPAAWPTLVPQYSERLGKMVLVEKTPDLGSVVSESEVAVAAVHQVSSEVVKRERVFNPTYNDVDDVFTHSKLYGYWVHERLLAEASSSAE